MDTINRYLTDTRWFINELFQAHIMGPIKKRARLLLASEFDNYIQALAALSTQAREKTELARDMTLERDDMRRRFQYALEMADWARSDKCPEGARSAMLCWAGLLNWEKQKNTACTSKAMFGIVDDFARWGLTR